MSATVGDHRRRKLGWTPYAWLIYLVFYIASPAFNNGTWRDWAWTLGTVSYYLIPTLGPGLMYPWLTSDLTPTGTSALMDSLVYSRQGFLWGEGDYQGVAGFASLHTAITLLVALMVQYTVRNKILKWVFWVNFVLTVIATIYFGWHYIADDIAGIMIALVAFYVGGIASGQKFERHGLTSYPTADTAAVPVLDD